MGFLEFFKPNSNAQEISSNTVRIVSNSQTILMSNDKETLIQLDGKEYRIPNKSNKSISIGNDKIYVNDRQLTEKELEKYLIN